MAGPLVSGTRQQASSILASPTIRWFSQMRRQHICNVPGKPRVCLIHTTSSNFKEFLLDFYHKVWYNISVGQ